MVYCIKKHFGKLVCTDCILKHYMPVFWFKKYMRHKANGVALDEKIAARVALAAKSWATKNGATHYVHWFMPIGGKSAGKQVCFLDIDKNGRMIEALDAKALIAGETDASSFPNGGERSTFEARGYTIWDYTSPMFICEDNSFNRVLFIPTAFCSYGGVALDEKTPLLRANEALNEAARRVLRNLGYEKVKKVESKIGVEQEYFLLKKDLTDQRLDIKMTGRTLFGSAQLKRQEANAHYCCPLDDEVSKFMHEANKKLWEMGVAAKLQHNEAAPLQHEFVSIYSSNNIAADQNQLVMQTLSGVAKQNGLVALFHEKPFMGNNGSGKHINWSITTDLGQNLFDSNLSDNSLFLLFFASFVAAADEFCGLLYASVCGRGNDLRLGGYEAPPTTISLFVGDVIEKLFSEKNFDSKNSFVEHRVKTLPHFQKDVCDRNRTSPLAFCGDRFEFRMVGASGSVAWPCTCLNVALAKVLGDVADVLDVVEGDKRNAAKTLAHELYESHKRIIFNGNAYDKEWEKEAKARGLVTQVDTVSCCDELTKFEVVETFKKLGVMSENELKIRQNAMKKAYAQNVEIEARTMCEMLTKQIYPSLRLTQKYYDKAHKNELFGDFGARVSTCFEKLTSLHFVLLQKIQELQKVEEDDRAEFSKKHIVLIMDAIRGEFDKIEPLIPASFKPFPNQNDLLSSFD